MCQAGGVRCYNDSSKKLNKINTKLNSARAELDVAKKTMTASARKSDFNGYAKVRKQVETLQKKVEVLETDHRYVQRDVDGTLTGRKLLEKEYSVAKTASELEALDIRRRTADSLRYNREHAFQLIKTGYVPAIRFSKAS